METERVTVAAAAAAAAAGGHRPRPAAPPPAAAYVVRRLLYTVSTPSRRATRTALSNSSSARACHLDVATLCRFSPATGGGMDDRRVAHHPRCTTHRSA